MALINTIAQILIGDLEEFEHFNQIEILIGDFGLVPGDTFHWEYECIRRGIAEVISLGDITPGGRWYKIQKIN